MGEGQNEQGGVTGATQGLANQGIDTVQDTVKTLVDAAQEVANGVYDFGEEVAGEAAGAVLQGLLTANRLIGEALEKAASALPKPSGQ